jgi:hypothetical protein
VEKGLTAISDEDTKVFGAANASRREHDQEEIRERSGWVHGLGYPRRRGGDMADGFVHTVHADGSWRNSVENAAPLPGTYDTKAVAVEAGRAEAKRRKTEHLIHNEDGSISERNSYGGDPAHRPG